MNKAIKILFVILSAAMALQSGNKAPGKDEIQTKDNSSIPLLRFSSLGAWEYSKNNISKPPQPLQQMSGKMVQIMGFMYPLEEWQYIKNFCLLKSTQTCCYGPKPQFNQYVFVEMNESVKLERLKPVVVTGKFFIDPKPEDGYVYRLEGIKVEPAEENKPAVNIITSDARSKITIFDFGLLEALQPSDEQLAKINELKDFPDIKKFPENITKLEGKLVTVEAFIAGRLGDQQEYILGKYWWDGCCQGVPPSFYNSIIISLKKGEKPPNLSAETGIFTGTLRTCKDKFKWPQNGIIHLEDAVCGVPK